MSGPHAAPKEEFLPERKKFLASDSIDDFLEKRHKEYINLLEKHAKEKTLYFTQEIDAEVLEYVRKTPTCQNGVRNGSVIRRKRGTSTAIVPGYAKPYYRI